MRALVKGLRWLEHSLLGDALGVAGLAALLVAGLFFSEVMR